MLPETRRVDRWTEMALFVQVAEAGSLSRAAEALGLSRSYQVELGDPAAAVRVYSSAP